MINFLFNNDVENNIGLTRAKGKPQTLSSGFGGGGGCGEVMVVATPSPFMN